MKILNVVGARPNFVKIAPLLGEMRKQPGIQPLLVHTGQHYHAEMSDCFFRDLDIPQPEIELGVVPTSSRAQIEEVIKRLSPVLIEERPDVVLVVGDVNSTLAGALAAAKLGIPVVHVEAGLRSFDRSMPEEINRLITDAISDLLFASEPSGVTNLLKEARPPHQIFQVGNVMIDTLQLFLPLARRSTTLADLGLTLSRDAGQHSKYALVTLHRPATVDHLAVFREVWEALLDIAGDIPIIFPVHPRTQMRFQEAGFKCSQAACPSGNAQGIRMTPPLGYLRFLHLESEASMVITDSGGVQEETTALGVPCLTVRENTERPITVIEGTNTIVGHDPRRIREEAHRVLTGRGKQGRIPTLWDGHAAARIVKILADWFGRRTKPYQGGVPRTMPVGLSALSSNGGYCQAPADHGPDG